MPKKSNRDPKPQCVQTDVSSSAFDWEKNFITCKCKGEIEVYPPNLGDSGYDWCKKCELPLGSV